MSVEGTTWKQRGHWVDVPTDRAHEFLAVALPVTDPLFQGWRDHFQARRIPVKIVTLAGGCGMIYTHRGKSLPDRRGFAWCCGYEPESQA